MGRFRGGVPIVPTFLVLDEKKVFPFESIINTGCGRTILSYDKAVLAGLDFKHLRVDEAEGIGGCTKIYELKGNIRIGLLDEEVGGKTRKVHVESLGGVYFFGKEQECNPSLLGWDVLSRFELSFNVMHNDISFKRLKVKPFDHKVLEF